MKKISRSIVGNGILSLVLKHFKSIGMNYIITVLKTRWTSWWYMIFGKKTKISTIPKPSKPVEHGKSFIWYSLPNWCYYPTLPTLLRQPDINIVHKNKCILSQRRAFHMMQTILVTMDLSKAFHTISYAKLPWAFLTST